MRVLIDTAREVEGRAVRHTDCGVLLHRNLTTEGIDAVQSSQRNVTEATSVNSQRVNDDVVRERDATRKGNRRVIGIIDRKDGVRRHRRGVGEDQHTLIDADTTDDLLLGARIRNRTRARELTRRAEDERTAARLDEARTRGAA